MKSEQSEPLILQRLVFIYKRTATFYNSKIIL